MSTPLVHQKCEHLKKIRGRLVPCGHCTACLGRRNAEIVTRVVLDMKHSRKCCYSIGYNLGARFVHLTYNESSLPCNASLRKKDLELYLKRVRERIYELTGCRIRSVQAGEYGDKRGRPHYHIFFWRLPEFVGLFEILRDCWKLHQEGSRVSVERMRGNPAKAIAYCVGYSTKPSRKFDRRIGESVKEYIRRTGREPPFVHWSKGIGSEWFESNLNMLIENGGVIMLNGRRCAFPRYFRKRLQEKLGLDDYVEYMNEQVRLFKSAGVDLVLHPSEVVAMWCYTTACRKANKLRNKRRAVRRQEVKRFIKVFFDTPFDQKLDLSFEVVMRLSDLWFLYIKDVDGNCCYDSFDQFALHDFMKSFDVEDFENFQSDYRKYLSECLSCTKCGEHLFDVIDLDTLMEYYEDKCIEYMHVVAPVVEQAGYNYRCNLELRNADKYCDPEFQEVVDKERDLRRL